MKERVAMRSAAARGKPVAVIAVGGPEGRDGEEPDPMEQYFGTGGAPTSGSSVSIDADAGKEVPGYFAGQNGGESGDAENSANEEDDGKALIDQWLGKGRTDKGMSAEQVAAVQAELERYKPYAALVDELKAHGIHDEAAVRALLADPPRGYSREQAASAAPATHVDDGVPLGQKLEALRAELQGHVDSGAISPKDASAIWTQAAAHLQNEAMTGQAMRELAHHRAATGLAIAAKAYPELQAESGSGALVHALSASGMGEAYHVGALLGQMLRAHGQRAVAEYVARQGQAAQAPPTVGGGGAAPATAGERGNASAPWSKLLGIR